MQNIGNFNKTLFITIEKISFYCMYFQDIKQHDNIELNIMIFLILIFTIFTNY